jgi:hypothetical protein
MPYAAKNTVFTAAVFGLASIALARAQSPLPPAQVQKVLKANCLAAGCHTGKYPAVNLNLEPENAQASLFDRPSLTHPDFKLIDPSAPEKSYILMKLRGAAGIAGQRMPLNRDPLAEKDLNAIADWVSGLKERKAGNGSGLDQNPDPEKPVFWGMTLANLPTTRTIDKGRFLFRLSHRFLPSVRSGGDSFFGLDGPSSIFVAFGYGLSDRLSLTLGRANLFQEIETAVHWSILEQSPALPFDLSLHAGTALVTQKTAGRSLWDGENVNFNLALSIARRVTERLSVLFVPIYATNTGIVESSGQGTFSLGLGGRFMVVKDISLLAEWIPVLSGNSEAGNGWAFGLEKKIGGHVFQFFALNTVGSTSAQFLPGGDLLLREGDFRFGFNIYRLF